MEQGPEKDHKMLVRKDKRALIFKLQNPTKITTVIPTAKIVLHKGYPLVAVPHRPDECRVLNNLGFKTPDPMRIYYDYPGRFTPFAAQAITASFLTMHDRAFCLNSMGMGKTITTLWAYDYLRSVKQAKRMLVVCPLSTMETTWAQEVFDTFPHLEVAVLHGSLKRRLKLLAQPADIYIINTDGVELIADALKVRDDINLIAVDEIAMYRNASTDRWKALNTIANKQSARKVWGLTGAPIPHEPTDAWAQCRIVVPDSPDVPKYFGPFRDMVMRQATQFKWVPKDNATDTVFRLMQPAIRFALDDCVDLPPEIHLTREVPMTKEQKDAYKDMLAKLRSEYQGGEILAVNDAVKAGKLLQIALGVAYGANHESIIIPAKPRMDELKTIIEESEGKVLVFVPLTGALEHVAAELAKDWTVSVVHGGVSKTKRDEIFKNFQNSDDPHIIVAEPRTMSHGLTLTRATSTVWFGPTNSNDTYIQACARVRRPGQTKTTRIIHLVSSEIEKRMFSRLKNKQAMQGVLLDMFAEEGKELEKSSI
jgi:SNF2 family DNA or RNA helicase